MARKLKAQGGPLDGKTVVVHETQKTFTHHGDTDGHYRVNEKSVTWQPNTKPAESAPARAGRRNAGKTGTVASSQSQTASAPAPGTPKAKSAPKPQAPAPADAPVDLGAASAEPADSTD